VNVVIHILKVFSFKEIDFSTIFSRKNQVKENLFFFANEAYLLFLSNLMNQCWRQKKEWENPINQMAISEYFSAAFFNTFVNSFVLDSKKERKKECLC